MLGFFLSQYEQLFCRYYAEDISRNYKNFKLRVDELQDVSRFYKIKKNDNRINKVFEYLKEQKRLLDGGSSELDNLRTPSVKGIRELVKYIERKRSIVLYKQMYYIQKLCGNAATEYTYCKTLLESKYNKNHHHNTTFDDAEIDKLWKSRHGGQACDEELKLRDCHRKMAFNIRNSMRYINGVRINCSAMGNELTQEIITQNQNMLLMSDKVNKTSKILAWLSFALGIAGIVIGVLGYLQSMD